MIYLNGVRLLTKIPKGCQNFLETNATFDTVIYILAHNMSVAIPQ